jgi:hypothetical protein
MTETPATGTREKEMNGRTDEHAHRPDAHLRRSQILAYLKAFELRTVELRIASGEQLHDVLKECAQRLSAIELADARREN